MDYLKEFIIKLQNLDHSRRIDNVFRDFLALSTYAIMQPFYRNTEIEQKYLDIINKYNREQANEFSQMLALLVNALEFQFQDFLGQVYMQLNLGNAKTGQFFTPYSVSKMMSEITFLENKDNIENQEIITLSEPCCGSGGIIIAYAETMKQHKINYQQKLFVEAIDIDELCFQMAYIQLSLYGIPARVILGDTLAYKFKQSIYTPMYFTNNFEYKLKRYEKQKEQSKDNNNQQFKDLKEMIKTADIYFEDDRIKIRPKNSSNLALNGTSSEIYYVPYEISTDLTTITIQNRQYKIPNWYNKEMIKQKDQKTLEMILISCNTN